MEITQGISNVILFFITANIKSIAEEFSIPLKNIC